VSYFAGKLLFVKFIMNSEGLGIIPVSLTIKVKLVLPSFLWMSYVSPPLFVQFFNNSMLKNEIKLIKYMPETM
jgi:hypothetical protein